MFALHAVRSFRHAVSSTKFLVQPKYINTSAIRMTPPQIDRAAMLQLRWIWTLLLGGHTRSVCPKEKIPLCNRCGMPGHKAGTCPEKVRAVQV
ncbi:hypothetical protein BDZ89DRAFT_1056377 [Hymenopellis radicata]|nr:hypothetical protein BDZ89DRAFT_1056377 [Hymenopellis radicata]